MEGDVIAKFEDFVRRKTEARPGAVIKIVAVRNDGIETIVAPGHLEDDQNGGVSTGGNLGGFVGGLSPEGGEGVGEESGQGPRESATEDGGAEELASGVESEFGCHMIK
jgi:hypothetical protein